VVLSSDDGRLLLLHVPDANGLERAACRLAARRAFAVSNESFWVKVVALWVCLGLYAWTLLAPYLLRNHRSFGIEFDFD